MPRKTPLVSVVMSVYNAEAYVNRAIESILSQTLTNFELIIINDASSDKTLALVRSYMRKDKRIRLINNYRNLKVAHSLNKGVSLAKTDLIARMDSDDIALPKRLETQFEFMQSHPDVVIVGTYIRIIDENQKVVSKRTYPSKSDDLKRIMLRYSPFAHPTVMFRKKVFEEFGGYNPKMVPCEDIDFWFKAGVKYDFANIPKALLKYTLSTSSGSHYNLRYTELLGFKIKINAIKNLGYRPNIYDIGYNLLQFLTLWIMPTNTRIKLYNALRSHGLI